MSNFLLRDPDCVFIHIPKTGGSSIRNGIWADRYDGPAFGGVPGDWTAYFKFAFVRHPAGRLVSAYYDFTQMRNYAGTLDEFMDIVEDETVIFDERRSNTPERIRHHTIPQTHPFNCLDAADFVGRFEAYEEDLRRVLERVGLRDQSIPQIRRTEHKAWADVLSSSQKSRVHAYFKDDFEALEYDMDY